MRKVLIDEDVLKELIDSASFEARYYRLYQGYGDFSDRVYAQIAKAEKAIEESKEKRFSVLEWHPVSEKPKEGEVIVRMEGGLYALDYAIHWGNYAWQFQNTPVNHVKEWASLPE